MRRICSGALGICLLVGSLFAYQAGAVQGAAAYADPLFQQQWQQGEALTPNFWGPLPIAKDGQQEPYQEATGGQRLVQYFDKGRMELTNGTVSNGMLVTELVTGKIQVGDMAFEQRPPPAIRIVGESADSPTYAQLASIGASLLQPTTSTPGVLVPASFRPSDRDGGHFETTNTPVFVRIKGSVIGGYDERTQHNVTDAFAEYRTTVGRALIGDAISEPFATSYVNFTGGVRSGLATVQLFQRRVLTYTYEYGVGHMEMTNVGQHYYQWRYGEPLVLPPPPPVVRAGADPSPCTSACVFLDRVGGPGLENVTICQSFAGYGGVSIGTTDATGAYQAMVRSTQGHQETVSVWPVAAGYTFNRPYTTFLTASGGEKIDVVFVATASSDASSDGKCGSPPFLR